MTEHDINLKTNTYTTFNEILCIGCGACWISFILVGGSITYTVFIILALTDISSDDIHEFCPDSHTWEYVLVMTILWGINIYTGNSNYNNKEKSTMRVLVMTIILMLEHVAFAIWCGIELFQRSECVKQLDNTELLLAVATASFVINIVCASILFITIVVSIGMIYRQQQQQQINTDINTSEVDTELFTQIGQQTV
jgi:hypothetical protein